MGTYRLTSYEGVFAVWAGPPTPYKKFPLPTVRLPRRKAPLAFLNADPPPPFLFLFVLLHVREYKQGTGASTNRALTYACSEYRTDKRPSRALQYGR